MVKRIPGKTKKDKTISKTVADFCKEYPDVYSHTFRVKFKNKIKPSYFFILTSPRLIGNKVKSGIVRSEVVCLELHKPTNSLKEIKIDIMDSMEILKLTFKEFETEVYKCLSLIDPNDTEKFYEYEKHGFRKPKE